MMQITSSQILKKIQSENFWWDPPHRVHKHVEGLTPRPYLEAFFPLIGRREVRRAVVLMGPRRVGKTVLLHHAIQRLIDNDSSPRKICYISVDQPIYNGLGLDQLLQAFANGSGVSLESEGIFVFFDEIQYLKDWELHLKSLVDSYPHIQFVASGSAAAALRLRSHESGAGRFTDFLLPPLLFQEYLTLLGTTDLLSPVLDESGYISRIQCGDIDELNNHFLNYLNFGGYPEVALSPAIQRDPERYMKSDIIDKVLLRDLPSLYGVQDVQELNYLFTTLAYNTANEVSLEQLSSGSGVAKNTIRRYIEYLEAAFLVNRIHRVDRNARRFKRATSFKVYLTNPSIRAALFAPAEGDDETIGALVETAVFSQWFHVEAFRRANPWLYYARWKNGEIDIVSLDADQRVHWALEVKWSDRPAKNPSLIRKAIGFCQKHNLKNLTVTTKTVDAQIETGNVSVGFKPAACYCYQLGHNIFQDRIRHPDPSDID